VGLDRVPFGILLLLSRNCGRPRLPVSERSIQSNTSVHEARQGTRACTSQGTNGRPSLDLPMTILPQAKSRSPFSLSLYLTGLRGAM